jgi:hypothetical protein
MSFIRSNRWNLLLAVSLAAACVCPACGDNPATPGGGGASPTGPWHWAEVDTFTEGDRIASVYGTGPGNIYCASRRLKRYSDGWTLYPQGKIVNYDGTSWSSPLYHINATAPSLELWASAPTDIYLADGRLWHFDGSAWRDAGINAEVVFGLSDADVFAASLVDNGAVYRYHGRGWTELTRLAGDERFKAVYALAGPFLIVAREHSIAMWDGTTWSEKSFLSYEYVEDVWASSPEDVYVVGNGYPDPRVWHFDGAAWSEMTVPDVGSFNAVWGSSPTDIYACGREGSMIRYDGSTWNEMKVNTYKSFWDIWGSGPDDVYAVGDDDKVMHFDGTGWNCILKESPDRPYIIWAESADRFAVSSGIDAGTLYLYDQGEWSEHYVAGDRYAGIRSIAGTSLEDLTVLISRETYHYDGQDWTESAYLDADFPGEMWFAPSGRGFAIGGTSIFQFNGSSWSETVTGLPWTMMGLWAESENAVYAINKELLVYYYDGQRWETIPSPVDEGILVDIWGVSSDEVYVLAGTDTDDLAGGGLFRWNGGSWTEVPSPDDIYLSNLVLSSGDNMFLWGGCCIGHFGGIKWSIGCFPESAPYQIIQALDGSILKLTRRSITIQAFDQPFPGTH